jgi:hypothetical protein
VFLAKLKSKVNLIGQDFAKRLFESVSSGFSIPYGNGPSMRSRLGWFSVTKFRQMKNEGELLYCSSTRAGGLFVVQPPPPLTDIEAKIVDNAIKDVYP